MFLVTVHTTGVNWQGVLANAASVVVILGAFGALIVRSIKRATKDEIEAVIDAKVTPTLMRIDKDLRQHDTRIARLEGIDEGMRRAVAQAHTVTTEIAKEMQG